MGRTGLNVVMSSALRYWLLLTLGLLLAQMAQAAAAPEDRLTWHADQQTLDVNLNKTPLIPALDQLARITGWHIYLEPVPGKTITTRFTGLSRGEAMRVLLGDMNYAFVPQSDGPTKLFVFRTSRDAATTVLRGEAAKAKPADDRRIPNQLIIKVKPGTDIEALAKKLGAKITGRLDKLGVYRLEFENNDATETARKDLLENPEVEGVDYNYTVDRPNSPQLAPGQTGSPLKLSLKPPAGDGKVVVGLIDTAVQSLGNGLDSFMLQAISVAGEAGAGSGLPTHGTSMAYSVLLGAQSAAGNGTSIQILPVDVYGANPTASTFDVAAGILAAVNNGANVINLSLGTTADSAFLRSLIQAVSAQNIPIFGAAGNLPVATPTYPAAYPEVIAVTAGQNGQLANYANYGSFVDVIAPGTSYVYFNGQMWAISGTSSATAFASGKAAGLAGSTGTSTASAASTVSTSMTFQPPAAK